MDSSSFDPHQFPPREKSHWFSRKPSVQNTSTTRRVNFFDGVWAGFSNLFNFKERMRRSEYWWFFLFSILFAVVSFFGFLIWLDYWEQIYIERFRVLEAKMMFPFWYTTYSMPVYFFMGLMFSAQVRRFHDVGKWTWIPYAKTLVFVVLAWHVHRLSHAVHSFDFKLDLIGWLLLLTFFVLAGVIAYVACKDSEKERNRFGVSPKYRRKIYEDLPPPPPAPKKSELKKM